VTTSEITPLLSPLAAVQQLLARLGDQGLVIGGVAASVLGAPRFTADVDVVILLSVGRLPELFHVAAELGLVPRIANAEQFARRNQVALLRHEESGISVDVSLGMLPFEEEAVARGAVHRIGDVELRLPTPEDLIIFRGSRTDRRICSTSKAFFGATPISTAHGSSAGYASLPRRWRCPNSGKTSRRC